MQVGPLIDMRYSDTAVVGGGNDAGALICARLDEHAQKYKPKGAKKARKETTKGQGA